MLAGVVALIVLGVVIVAAALRSMRPKEPEPQTYTAPVVTARSAPTSAVARAGSGLDPRATAEIDRLVAAGQKIHAIKAYRQHTGVGLKEAKDRIDHWSISTTAPHLAAVSHSPAARTSLPAAHLSAEAIRSRLSPAVAAEIDRLVLSGQKITAIKLLREQTGLGLKETKDQIEAWVPRGRP